MILRLVPPISRFLSNSGSKIPANRMNSQMGSETKNLFQQKKKANFRLVNVSGFKTDLLEINSHEPTLHVLFVPGNPGVISFYTEFLESLYELLGGTASVTGIGHISHSQKNWESNRLFSLEEQINHKINFMEQENQDAEVPIILVGHSIGSYISLEMLKRSHKKVLYCIGLYPFLAVNTASSTQSSIRRLAMSAPLSTLVSSMGALFGALPLKITRTLVKISIGKSWSSSAVEALCTHVLKYHTLRNMLFMAMTEFQTMPAKPDWEFMRSKRSEIAFLFGLDDHWGPLRLYEEELAGFLVHDSHVTIYIIRQKSDDESIILISKIALISAIREKVPDAFVEVEREGHTHAFSCSLAGSRWVAHHISTLIKNNIQQPNAS